MYPEIQLKATKEKSLERKHLWVFSGAIKEKDNSITNGDIVRVVANKGRFLGIGQFSDEGSIAVRILTFEDIEINEEFWFNNIQEAYNIRKATNVIGSEQNIYRLIHAEGDFLPGLIIDIYNDTAVIQCHSYGMYLVSEQIAKAVQKVLGKNITTIYNKSSSVLKVDNIEDRFLLGDSPETIASEHGIQYHINCQTGQKTGFFIDQRENRKLLLQYSDGKKVLNTYCYSGGFSLAALKGNASLVHSVDSSAPAIELLEKNIPLNEFSGEHKSFCEDTITFLKDMKIQYDIIVLDPPAFAKHMRSRHNAIQGYKRINGYALRNIQPGGLLFTFSCSQVVDNDLFKRTVMAAAIAAGRKVRILHQLHQPADHPVNIFQPESEYLKGLVLEVE